MGKLACMCYRMVSALVSSMTRVASGFLVSVCVNPVGQLAASLEASEQVHCWLISAP